MQKIIDHPKTVQYRACGTIITARVKFAVRINGIIHYFITVKGIDGVTSISEKEVL